jgi:hypothetical protein
MLLSCTESARTTPTPGRDPTNNEFVQLRAKPLRHPRWSVHDVRIGGVGHPATSRHPSWYLTTISRIAACASIGQPCVCPGYAWWRTGRACKLCWLTASATGVTGTLSGPGWKDGSKSVFSHFQRAIRGPTQNR